MHYALSSVSPVNLYRCQILCDIVVRISHRLPRLRHRRSKNHFPSARSQQWEGDFLGEAQRWGRCQASELHPLRGAYFAIIWGEVVNIFLTSLYTYQLFSAVEHPPFGGFLQFCKVQAQGR